MGAGKVGASLAKGWACAGHSIVVGVKDTTRSTLAAIKTARAETVAAAAMGADVIVLAVP